MRPRILLTVIVTALFVILSGCGTRCKLPHVRHHQEWQLRRHQRHPRARTQPHRRAGRSIQLLRH